MKNFLEQNIRYLRRQKGWSQEQLGEQLSLNRGNIASYEKGTAQPRICNLIKLSNLFSVSIPNLIQDDLTQLKNPCGIGRPSRLSIEDQENLDRITSHLDELRNYIDSVNSCQAFKLGKIENPSKEMQHLVNNFDQLFEASQMLIQEQSVLIRMVKAHFAQAEPNTNPTDD